jgi:hypothetical protein
MPLLFRKSGGKIVNAVHSTKALAISQLIFKPKKVWIVILGRISVMGRRLIPHYHLSQEFDRQQRCQDDASLPIPPISLQRTYEERSQSWQASRILGQPQD